MCSTTSPNHRQIMSTSSRQTASFWTYRGKQQKSLSLVPIGALLDEKVEEETMVAHTLKVKGMHCKSCKMLVEEALQDIGAKNISISVDEKKQEGKVEAEHADRKKIIAAIEKEGYKVVQA